jgi:uncharacterized protein YndB with AHSA1/START domain
MNADVVTVQRTIKARPETVFSFFTDRERLLSWQGVSAEIDARPGGVFRVNVRGDGWARGTFTVVDPYRRIVFTWGWEGDDSALPPGSSTVEITLEPEGDHTVLTLRHSGLPLPALDAHRDGWNHYLDRLTIRAAGGDPGPDPTAEPQLLVECACGQRWQGAEAQVIAQVQRHGIDVHNMHVTPDQVRAMASTVEP